MLITVIPHHAALNYIFLISLVIYLVILSFKNLSFALVKAFAQYRANAVKSKHLQIRQSHKEALLSYNPVSCGALDRFYETKMKSPCIFAKHAVLWGSREYERKKSIEENVLQTLPAFCKFASMVDDKVHNLDGFLIEIKGKHYCDSVPAFAATVSTVLNTLGDNDPSGLNTMRMKSIGTSSSWYFSFDMVPMFVTTFAPCYTKSSPRQLHLSEDSLDSCFILLQPEVSFLKHNIGSDSVKTAWKTPLTIRDKIRVNFRHKSQSYFIPPTLKYPVAATFVHSCDGKTHSIEFWDEEKYPLRYCSSS
jgi:hypothetical protein